MPGVFFKPRTAPALQRVNGYGLTKWQPFTGVRARSSAPPRKGGQAPARQEACRYGASPPFRGSLRRSRLRLSRLRLPMGPSLHAFAAVCEGVNGDTKCNPVAGMVLDRSAIVGYKRAWPGRIRGRAGSPLLKGLRRRECPGCHKGVLSGSRLLLCTWPVRYSFAPAGRRPRTLVRATLQGPIRASSVAGFRCVWETRCSLCSARNALDPQCGGLRGMRPAAVLRAGPRPASPTTPPPLPRDLGRVAPRPVHPGFPRARAVRSTPGPALALYRSPRSPPAPARRSPQRCGHVLPQFVAGR